MSQSLYLGAARRPARSIGTPMFPLTVILVSVIVLALLFLLAAAGLLPAVPAGPEFTT
jgi:hypothetical protein